MAGSRFFRRLRVWDAYTRRLEADNLRLRRELDVEATVARDMAEGLQRVVLELEAVYLEWEQADEDSSLLLPSAGELAEALLRILQHSHPDYVLAPSQEE